MLNMFYTLYVIYIYIFYIIWCSIQFSTAGLGSVKVQLFDLQVFGRGNFGWRQPSQPSRTRLAFTSQRGAFPSFSTSDLQGAYIVVPRVMDNLKGLYDSVYYLYLFILIYELWVLLMFAVCRFPSIQASAAMLGMWCLCFGDVCGVISRAQHGSVCQEDRRNDGAGNPETENSPCRRGRQQICDMHIAQFQNDRRSIWTYLKLENFILLLKLVLAGNAHGERARDCWCAKGWNTCRYQRSHSNQHRPGRSWEYQKNGMCVTFKTFKTSMLNQFVFPAGTPRPQCKDSPHDPAAGQPVSSGTGQSKITGAMER